MISESENPPASTLSLKSPTINFGKEEGQYTLSASHGRVIIHLVSLILIFLLRDLTT